MLKSLDKDSSLIFKTKYSGDSIRISIIPKGDFIESGEKKSALNPNMSKCNKGEWGKEAVKKGRGKERTVTLPGEFSGCFIKH